MSELKRPRLQQTVPLDLVGYIFSFCTWEEQYTKLSEWDLNPPKACRVNVPLICLSNGNINIPIEKLLKQKTTRIKFINHLTISNLYTQCLNSYEYAHNILFFLSRDSPFQVKEFIKSHERSDLSPSVEIVHKFLPSICCGWNRFRLKSLKLCDILPSIDLSTMDCLCDKLIVSKCRLEVNASKKQLKNVRCIELVEIPNALEVLSNLYSSQLESITVKFCTNLIRTLEDADELEETSTIEYVLEGFPKLKRVKFIYLRGIQITIPYKLEIVYLGYSWGCFGSLKNTNRLIIDQGNRAVVPSHREILQRNSPHNVILTNIENWRVLKQLIHRWSPSVNVIAF